MLIIQSVSSTDPSFIDFEREAHPSRSSGIGLSDLLDLFSSIMPRTSTIEAGMKNHCSIVMLRRNATGEPALPGLLNCQSILYAERA
jgi:hypothetical protein